ncbi:unnamed protein product [Rotaria sp. Silwood1]|nr:unnamed protein product [Rotaria sp. Silwood1]
MATATPSDRAKCFSCDKEKIIYPCEGCSKKFCLKDLTEHRQNLNKQFEGIENERNQFYQKLTERKKGLKKLPSLQDVDEWKEELIAKIQQTAEEYKQTLVEHNKHFIQIEEQLSRLTAQLKQARQENEFNEIDLDQFKIKLTKLTEELSQPSNIKLTR